MLDAIIWDGTGYEGAYFRSFVHNDMAMIRLMIPALREPGIIHEHTAVILDHLARTLWPATLATPRITGERKNSVPTGLPSSMIPPRRAHPERPR